MKNNQPLVSVVIPCYNHEQFVKDSIQSVIDQTYENIELIIIDDGSKDESIIKIQEMVESCKQRFVRFEFRSRENKGLSETLNESLRWCQGKYYSAIASDDQMLNYKTEIQVKFLEINSNFTAVFGGVQLIDKNNKKLEKLVSEAKSYSFEDIIMHRHDILAPTQMIRKEAIEKVGGYNSSLFIEDWYMWLLLTKQGDIFNINKVLTLYRRHDSNSSNNLSKMHSGRFQVLSFFSDSKLYLKAMNNIRWLNAYEELIHIKHNRLENICKLFVLNPTKTSKIVIKKIFGRLV